MSLDGVSPNGAPNVDTNNDGVFDSYDPTLPAPEDTSSAPPNDPSSALDTFEIMAEDGDPATMQFLYELTGATTEQEMMDAINANPLAFLKAVYAWAEANGVTGTDDELIGMFLDRLRADMGFGTSSPGVPEENMIRLNGADDRTNALVSAIGQMIFEKYGADAYAAYRTGIEADWADDGALSDETLIMLDDTLSTAEAGYVPTYDADGNLLAPPPEVRIAQLYIQLAKESGAIDPDAAYNDIAAQTLFQTGQELGASTDPSVPTPLGDLLAALQKMNAVNAAYEENQRKFDAGEITEDAYLKTESLLNVQLTDARAAVSEAAVAAGMDPNEMLRKATAEGFVLALTDPATAAEIEALWLKRQERATLEAEVKEMLGNGLDINSPEVRGRLNRMAELDAEMAGLETTLNGKGIATTDDPHAWPGESFDDLYHGIFRVREGKLDQAYAAETTAATNGAPPSYADLIGQIEKLAALRAEYDQIAADEAAGTITPGVAETKRANLAAEIGALEAELAGLATANGLAADTFTDPGKSAGYVAAMKNDDLGPLFADWRNKRDELALAEAQLAHLEETGVQEGDTSLVDKRAEVEQRRAALFKVESEIRFKMNGGDTAVIPELDTKRAERDAAYQAWQAKLQAAKDAGVLDLNGVTEAYNAYAALDADVKALEARLLPTGTQWNGDIAALADGAIDAYTSGADVGWRIETDPAYFAGYQAPDVLTTDQMKQLVAYQAALDGAFADGVLSPEERAALVPLLREVAGFMPPSFFGTEDFAAMDPTDAAFDAILARSRDILGGSFTEGLAQRTSEITVENETLLMDADVATVLAQLFEAADGKLKGESASAHVQYVLQMLGINMTAEDVETFLAGGVLPPAKEKAMLVAAQFFAQSQGATVDDAAALNMLRNALKGDMGRVESDPGVDKWEEFTYAGTEETDSGSPATPQTEFLRSMLSVLHEIYAEVYGEEEAAKLDSEVGPRFYDGAIAPVYSYKDYATRGGDTGTAETFEYNELSRDHWDPETGQIIGFEDKPWINMEWKFTVVLTKEVTHEGGRSGDYTETLVEHIDPNDQARIAELKAEGYTIARVEAKEASEPQRMMARLIEGLIEYMKNYKPVYDADGNLTNPPPLARIAQYFVKTEFAADVAGRDYDYQDPNDQITGWEGYRIDDTGVHMSDTDAIKFMFTELGMPEGDLNTLFGTAGTQLDESSTIGGFNTKGDGIAFAVFDGVLFFGLFGFLGGLFDKLSTDPLTDFANDNLGSRGRDNWRAEHRDKMDDPGWVDIFVDALLIGAEVATLGIPLSAARFAKRGAEVADKVKNGSRVGDSTILRDGENLGEAQGPHGSGASFSGSAIGDSEPLLGNPANRHGLQTPGIEMVDMAPVLPDGRAVPLPTTKNVFKWEPGVTLEIRSPDQIATLNPTSTPGIFRGTTPTGEDVNYALMTGPDGKDVYVRVDYVETKPAVEAKEAVYGPDFEMRDRFIKGDPKAVPPTLDRTVTERVPKVPELIEPAVDAAPAEYEWRIYSPSEGSGGVATRPIVISDGADKFKLSDSTAVDTLTYQTWIENGTIRPTGTSLDQAVVPDATSNATVRSVRAGEPFTFTTDDPMTLLTPNGKNYINSNPVFKEKFLADFSEYKAQNDRLQIDLRTAKQDKAYWEQVEAKLKAYQEAGVDTWAALEKRDPNFVKSLTQNDLTRRTFEGILPETNMNTVIAGAKREKDAAIKNVTSISGEIIANGRAFDGLVSQANGEGNGMQTRSRWFILRNAGIIAGVGLVSAGIGIGTKNLNAPKPDTKAEFIDRSQVVTLPEDGKETVDIAGISGTKGKGYTYENTSTYLNDNGVKIDATTGELTLTSGPDTKFKPGDEVIFTVAIKDKSGNYVGTVTITVTVDGKPADLAA